jgi:hypothetical protein
MVMKTGRSLQMEGTMARFVLRALVLTALLGLAAGPAFAGSEARKGTAGAMELRIPVGARGTALGGAVASDITGVESMFWNPAGLAEVTGTDVMFSHQNYFADMKLNYAGVATSVGGFGVVGVSVKVLSIGDIYVTTEQAPDGTGEILTPTFSVLGASWARKFTDRVNFGGSMSYVAENVADNTANGLAFDFGVQYITDWHGFRLGMVIKNFGTSMQYSGPGFEVSVLDPCQDPNAGVHKLSYESTKFEMPSYLSLSTNYNIVQSSKGRLTALAAFQNNNFSGDNLRGGLEWVYRDMFALRGSYFGSFNGTIDQTTGAESYKFDSGDDLYSGWAFGAGLNTRLGEASHVGVDFAYRPIKDGLFDDTYELGVHLRF